MSTNIFAANGLDLDSVFAQRTSSATTNVSFESQSVDISQRFEKLSIIGNDAISFNTGLETGSLDLRYYFRDIHSRLQVSGSSQSFDDFESGSGYSAGSNFVSAWTGGFFWPATGSFFVTLEWTASDAFEQYNTGFTSYWNSGSGSWGGFVMNTGSFYTTLEYTSSDDMELYTASTTPITTLASGSQWNNSASFITITEYLAYDDFELYTPSTHSIIYLPSASLYAGVYWANSGSFPTSSL